MSATEASGALPDALPPAIFDSTDAWAAYLNDAQARLTARRKSQELRLFWEAALQQADELLREAQASGGAEMEAEFALVAEGFRARLGGDFQAPPLSLPLEPSEEAVLPAAPSPAIVMATTTAADEPPTAGTVTAEPVTQTVEIPLPRIEAEEAPPPPPLPPLDPEAEERQAALVETFLEIIGDREREWAAVREQGLAYNERERNRPNLFRVRGIACALAGLFARARAQNVGALVRPAAVNVREQLRAARNSIGDTWDFVAFEEAQWVNGEKGLPDHEWQELARRYGDMAEAQTVYEWFLSHENLLNRQTRHDLLNAILAVHQGLCRQPEMMRARDPLLTTVFYDIKNQPQEAGFLSAMSSDTAPQTLDEIGAKLQTLWKGAQTEAKAFDEAQAKADRKQDAVDAVVAFMNTCGDQTPLVDALVPLLEACVSVGVPPTNAAVRNALLFHGPTLLTGRPRFAKILEAVRAERRRRKMDEMPAPPPASDVEGSDEDNELALGEQAEAGRHLQAWLGGKKVMILGGIPRQRTCDVLKRVCGCADVQWPPSTDTDTAAKFRADIEKSDVLLLLKNFARHDMSKRGREWIINVGGHFVFIPSGYGVSQILHQLNEYAALNKLVEA